MIQQYATCHNRVSKQTQHVAPNNVVKCDTDILRSFGRGFTNKETLNLLETFECTENDSFLMQITQTPHTPEFESLSSHNRQSAGGSGR